MRVIKKDRKVSDFFPVYVYFGLVTVVTLSTLALSALFLFSKTKSPTQAMPYESGIQTQTHLLQQRFPLHHYLVALIFLIFDVEVIFMYPWAVVAKSLGPFAFYEMVIFVIALTVAFIYVWRKGGLKWE